MNRHVLALSLLLANSSLLLVAQCRAQGSSSDKAAAEALFNEGLSRTQAGDFPAACGKFEASQALDPTLGTTLHLADCYEHVGRTASAWALWKQGEGIAHRQGEVDRESLARERAQAMESRLSYLTLKLESDAPPGLVVTRNGQAVPLPSLGVAIPVDPGPEELSASAPGRAAWVHHLEVASKPGTMIVQIPTLQVLPPKPALVNSSAPRAEPAAHTRKQRVLSIAASATGVAAILAAGGLAWYANHENNRSQQDEFCPSDGHNGCTSGGVSLRERAQAFARASTITLAAGAAVTGLGIVLWSTAPAEKERAATAPMRVTAALAPGAFAAALRGTW